MRLAASGVCHSDYNAIDGTSETRCPAVLGHEGAGVVEAVGDGVKRVTAGDHVALSWTPWCGTCEECLRDLPQLCSTVWPAMGTGGLMDGTPRLSRDGEPVFHYSLPLDVRRRLRRPRALLRPDPDGRPVRRRRARRLRRDDRRRRRVAHRGCAAGERVAIVGCGGVGLSALMAAVAVGAEPVVAVDAAPQKLDVARSFGATRRCAWQGSAEATAEAVRDASGGGVDYAIEATGRPEAMQAAFLSTRARGAAVLIGIPRPDAMLVPPGAHDPAYGAARARLDLRLAKPERDFPHTLDLYREDDFRSIAWSRIGCRSKRPSAASS